MAVQLVDDPEVSASIALFSAWTESQMAYAGLPGLSIGIVYDQRLVWSQGFGYADLASKRAATPGTIYRIASITKLFTSTAIMQLRDQGKLQLDDPVSRHLDWLNIRQQYPDGPAITLRHLLTHTGGLPRESDFPYWDDQVFPTQAEMRARLAEQKTIYASEIKWKYSNLGLALAGEVVEAVSGQPYTEYVQEHILAPLGMTSTYISTIDADHPQLATGYSRRLPGNNRDLAPFTDCKGITPAANMASTVEDLAKFAMLQFSEKAVGGAQILRASTLREMRRVHWLNDDWNAGRGLGFYVWRHGGKTLAGHGGALRGYRTDFQVCVADKIGVIVLTNADDGNPLQYVMKAFDWIAPALAKAAAPKQKKAKAKTDLSIYTGRFRNAWGDMQVLLLNGKLVAIDPSVPDPKASEVALTPVTGHTFVMAAKNNFGSDGEQVIYEFDDEGRIVRIKTGANYSYPVTEW